MSYLLLTHRIVGSLLLPLLLLLAAVWFTVTWKPARWPTGPARLFRVLVGIQGLLGLVYWIVQLVGGSAGYYFAFPFLLHPIVGILAVVVAQLLVRPNAISARLGRWTPVVSFGSILLLVLGAVMIVNNV